MIGIHHFYLGNVLHGLIDLGMFLAAVSLFAVGDATGNGAMIGLAILLFLADGIHTIVVLYRLVTGKTTDGSGQFVAYPGQ